MNKLLKFYGVLTTFGMFLIVLMGSIVTKTGSADGCGNSWPLCYGEWLPSEPATSTIIEYSHRVVSAILGLMVIILAVWTWKKIGYIKETKALGILSVFLITFQGLLGAAAVIWGQSSFVLALHFGISLLSLASVFLLTMLVFEADNGSWHIHIAKPWHRTFIALFAYMYFVIYTGALVRHTKASLACTTWPLCQPGEWLPRWDSLAVFHFGHRIAAGLLVVWLFITFIKIAKAYQSNTFLYRSVLLALLLVLLQATTGALVVLTRLNLFITLAHGFFITCLFTILSYLLFQVIRSS